MPIQIDPETRQRVVFGKHSGDIQYYANKQTTQSAVYNETVPVIGPWQDYTGTNPSQVTGSYFENFTGSTYKGSSTASWSGSAIFSGNQFITSLELPVSPNINSVTFFANQETGRFANFINTQGDEFKTATIVDTASVTWDSSAPILDGYSLRFDGTNTSGVPMTSINSTELNKLGNDYNQYAINYWIKFFSGIQFSTPRMIDKGAGAYPFSVRTTSSQDSVALAIFDSTNNPNFTSNVLTKEVWHNVVFNVDRIGKVVYVYVDNVLHTSGADTTSGLIVNTGSLSWGNSTSLPRRFKGNLADVRFYNKLLTAEERQTIYDKGTAISGLIGRYMFTEGTGNLTFDTCNWQQITNGDTVTYSTPQKVVRWKIVENLNSTGIVSNVNLSYNGTTSPAVNSVTQQQFAGVTNILQGGVAGIEGAKLPQLNEVGERAETTRRRIRLIHKEIENDKFR